MTTAGRGGSHDRYTVDVGSGASEIAKDPVTDLMACAQLDTTKRGVLLHYGNCVVWRHYFVAIFECLPRTGLCSRVFCICRSTPIYARLDIPQIDAKQLLASDLARERDVDSFLQSSECRRCVRAAALCSNGVNGKSC